MENQIRIFENNEYGSIRTTARDGEPWFVAADVCKILGLEQVSRAMSRLDEDEKGLLKVTHPQNPNKMMDVNGVNEAGLYHLILCSNKPEAKAFKRWITHDVIPTIRKTVSALESVEYNGNIDGIVYAKDGNAITNSRMIAEVFTRNHKDIIRAIEDKLMTSDKECAQFCANHIHASRYIDSRNRVQLEYELDEEGFSYVALSLTGEKADNFKVKYINAFSSMKRALRDMFKAKVIEEVLPQDNRSRQYIYIIKNPLNETIKIGVAHDVQKRIQQLQTGAGVELELVYQSMICSNAFSIENDVHKYFEQYRTFGEWFKVNPEEVIAFLDKQTFVLKSEFQKYLGVLPHESDIA